jgi:hypothetical protein
MTGTRKFFRKPRTRTEWTPVTVRNAIVAWARDHKVDPAVLGSAVWSLSIDLTKAAKVPYEKVIELLKEAWGKES